MLEYIKNEANRTLTENGAVTHATTGSDCLDLFATVGALRSADEAEIREYIDFCRASGIPTTLAALGLEGLSREEWRQAFDATLGCSQNHRSLPFPTSFDDLYDSLVQAQRFS